MKKILIVSLSIFSVICVFLLLSNLSSVEGQIFEENIASTTANVTVSGFIGDIIVQFFPVNFTPPGTDGLTPATDLNPKQNGGGVAYLRINTTSETNVYWRLWINASDLVDGLGHRIPVENISVNSTCNGIRSNPPLISLSHTLQMICGNLSAGGAADDYSIAKHNFTDVYFYLNVPAGQYNNTYTGNLTIYVDADDHNNDGQLDSSVNRTWNGTDNVTATVRKYRELAWSLVPIYFGTMNPGDKSNATDNYGFPANITNGAATNIPVDVYINGTDLNCTDCAGPLFPKILAGNLTFSNATSKGDWPSAIQSLSYTFHGCDVFPNWCNLPNQTASGPGYDVLNWWNISIPSGQPGGTYKGTIVAEEVDHGTLP